MILVNVQIYEKSCLVISFDVDFFLLAIYWGCKPTCKRVNIKKSSVMPQLGKVLIGWYTSAPIAQLNGNNIL